jgi:hypothetical protein
VQIRRIEANYLEILIYKKPSLKNEVRGRIDINPSSNIGIRCHDTTHDLLSHIQQSDARLARRFVQR